MSGLVLHGYSRSGAAYRVRIALALKGLAYDQVDHDLRTGAQGDAAYRALNPQALVPALETGDGAVLTQSVAILEWLDERFPTPPLLPADANGRAIVRGMMMLVAADIHPLHNLRVLNSLRDDLRATPDDVAAWTARWIGDGLSALETLVVRHGDGFAFGAVPTLADCMIVPLLYSAHRFGVDVAACPRVVAAGERTAALPAVASAHPSRQPDADPA